MTSLTDYQNIISTENEGSLKRGAAERSALNRSFAYNLDQGLVEQDIKVNGLNAESLQLTDQLSIENQRQTIAQAAVSSPELIEVEHGLVEAIEERYQNVTPDLATDMDQAALLATPEDDEYQTRQNLEKVRQKRLEDDPLYAKDLLDLQQEIFSQLENKGYLDFATDLGIMTIPGHLDSIYFGLRNKILPDKKLPISSLDKDFELTTVGNHF